MVKQNAKVKHTKGIFLCINILIIYRNIGNHDILDNEGWIASPVVRRKSVRDTNYINYCNATDFQSLFQNNVRFMIDYDYRSTNYRLYEKQIHIITNQ